MNINKKFIIDRIPLKYNEGLFWGNGFIGGLLYVIGSSLRISVDHTSLWETRDTTIDKPVAAFKKFLDNPQKFNNGEYTKTTDTQAVRIWRTKLPGLSLNLDLGSEIVEFYGDIDLISACSSVKVKLVDGRIVNCIIYIDSNVNILKVEADSDIQIEIKGWDTNQKDLSRFLEWGYSRYTQETHKNEHVIQPFSENGLSVLSLRKERNIALITLNAAKCEDKERLIEENDILLEAYAANEAKYKIEHNKSWEEFWSRFDLQVPNERLQEAFNIEMYKIYSNERISSTPVTLMGVWNNDGRFPAWCGDFHNDLNVQACYWPTFKTNNIELAKGYIEYYAKAMPRLEERAFKLFEIENAVHTPVMMAPEGYGAGTEWCFWNMLLGPELFNATDFCWYYEYSRDIETLKSCIYPFIEKVINLYKGIAYKGTDGYLHIPFTNSPEVFKDGSMLLGDDSTVVISTLHYLLEKMKNYSCILGYGDGSQWKEFDKNLTPLKISDKGYPLFPEQDVFESHRHFCQMFPVFPLCFDGHSETAGISLDTIINEGFTEYASWSFPYLSIFASRCGRGNMARTMLEIYCMAFRSRNTFTVNGDPYQNGIFRVSDTNAGENSDTFTVESGFMLAAAMSEMFVHRVGNDVYIGYGLPDEWKKCSCKNMTIEGGHRISVEVDGYNVKNAYIEANCDEIITVYINKSGETGDFRLVKGEVSIIAGN